MRESSPERAEASADAQGSACHVGSAVWVAEGTGSASEGAPAVPSSRKKPGRWLKGTVVAVGGTSLSSRTLTVETEDGRTLAGVPESDCPLQNSRDDTLDDLVRADFLHEPGYVLWPFFVDAPLKRKKRAIDFFLSVSCLLFSHSFLLRRAPLFCPLLFLCEGEALRVRDPGMRIERSEAVSEAESESQEKGKLDERNKKSDAHPAAVCLSFTHRPRLARPPSKKKQKTGSSTPSASATSST
jgi:hypothetical protein